MAGCCWWGDEELEVRGERLALAGGRRDGPGRAVDGAGTVGGWGREHRQLRERWREANLQSITIAQVCLQCSEGSLGGMDAWNAGMLQAGALAAVDVVEFTSHPADHLSERCATAAAAPCKARAARAKDGMQRRDAR